jgi:hypothetical protein
MDDVAYGLDFIKATRRAVIPPVKPDRVVFLYRPIMLDIL